MTYLRRFAESLMRHFELEKRRNSRRFSTSVVCYSNLFIIVGVIAGTKTGFVFCFASKAIPRHRRSWNIICDLGSPKSRRTCVPRF